MLDKKNKQKQKDRTEKQNITDQVNQSTMRSLK